MEDHQQPAHRDDVRQFHVHTCLGAGGFGEVYKATMTSAGGVRHEVAIKVLHEGLDPRSQAVQRLRDEGKLLGVLRHPAILRVHDLVLLSGRVSLVTEYIEGGDLDDCIRDGMPVRPLIDVCGQVASALDAAWNTESPDGEGKLHLVHRDVKPANIRVGRHGECKLLDFGIAKAAGVKREAHTQAKALIGSYLYMSPERLDRKEGFVPEGDVYALGAVLYEGITGERLFGEVDLKEQYKLSWDEAEHDLFIKRKVDAIPDLDDRVRELLTSTLAHGESERPSAHELSRVCEELADNLPGPSLRAWCRNHDWPAPGDDLGQLGGRTITETAFTTGTISSATLAGMQRPTTTQGGHITGQQNVTSFGYIEGVETLADPATSVEPGASGGRNRGLLLAAVVVLMLGGMLSLGMVGAAYVAMGNGDGAATADVPEPEPTAAPAPEPEPEPAAAPEPEPEPEPAADPEPTGEQGGTAEAPEPEPAPPQAPKPGPKAPEPTSTPPPAPPAAPEPKPAPTSSTGTVKLRGSVPVELRGAGKALPPGSVPAGSYEIWADFGQGMTRASMDMVAVEAGAAVTIKCSTLRQDCQVQ